MSNHSQDLDPAIEEAEEIDGDHEAEENDGELGIQQSYAYLDSRGTVSESGSAPLPNLLFKVDGIASIISCLYSLSST